jgi:DNA-binding transcriptional MerR regulator
MSERTGLMIGELAKMAGVTAEAIRFYEREQVIPRAKRGGSGYRRYDRADADRLRFIRRARDLGFSLEDVRGLVSLAESDPTRSCGDVDQIARAHIAQVDAKLAQLTALRTELSRLMANCDPNGEIADCSLLTALNK